MSFEIITKDNVKKIKVHNYFDTLTDDNINKAIYLVTIELLKKAFKNGGAESVALLNNQTFNYDVCSQGSFTNVEFNTDMINELLNNKSNTFTTIHNHPNGGTFSIMDINQFLIYDKITCMIVIENNCSRSYAIFKTDKIHSRIIFDIIKKLTNIVSNSDKSHNNADNIINNLVKLGIIYKVYINY